MAKKMVLALASSGVEKLTVGGIILSGAVAQDMEVKVFLLLGGAYAFRKDVADKVQDPGEAHYNKEELLNGFQWANVPYWLDYYKQAKELGNVTFLLCGTAGKIWISDKPEDFVDLVDEVCGIGEYISSIEEADFHIII